MARYLVNLVYDPEYKGYAADVPQLPGCMSQGKRIEDALTNVRGAIRSYVKASRHCARRAPGEIITAQVEL